MGIDDDALGELLDELEIGLELNSTGPALEPLLHALIDGAPHATVSQAAEEAAEALWDMDLELEVRAEIEAFREHAVRDHASLVPTIDAALAELGRPPRSDRVAHALVWRAAAKLVRRANRNHERVAKLERALERASQPSRRRRLTLPIAAAARLAADIGDEEAASAIATYAFGMPAAAELARSLATDERRRAVRASLDELGKLSAEEFPLASLALRELLAEPIPADPAKDEVWVNLVVGMAHEQLEDALMDATRH